MTVDLRDCDEGWLIGTIASRLRRRRKIFCCLLRISLFCLQSIAGMPSI
jgi:hypothetical protein